MDKKLLGNLEVSYAELNKLTADEQILLNSEINKLNPKALSLKSWYNTLTGYYLDTKDKILNNEITSFTFDDIAHKPYKISDLKEHLNEDDTSVYKIAQYIDVPFSDSKINLVDFTMHLKPNIALNKTTTMLPNGRPGINTYTYDGVVLAKIYFEFEEFDGLVTRRKEILKYIKNDGTESNPILIKEKSYDMSNLSDAGLVMKERITARTLIVDSLNLFILGVLSNYNPTKTQPELIEMVIPYWDATNTIRRKYVDIAGTEWKTSLQAEDINNLPADRTWLAYIIDANNTTLLDYIISRINY